MINTIPTPLPKDTNAMETYPKKVYQSRAMPIGMTTSTVSEIPTGVML